MKNYEFSEVGPEEDAMQDIVSVAEDHAKDFIVIARFPSGNVLAHEQGDVQGFLEALTEELEENPSLHKMIGGVLEKPLQELEENPIHTTVGAAKVQDLPVNEEGAQEVFPIVYRDVLSSVGEGMYWRLDGEDCDPDPKLSRQIIDDLKERLALGIQKYGLQLQTFNGRNALLDAYQESLDLMVYLRQRWSELGDKAPVELKATYWNAISMAASIRRQLNGSGS